MTPSGIAQALRIRTSSINHGSEMISKRFDVTSGNAFIGFWYAVVLENHQVKTQGGHKTKEPKVDTTLGSFKFKATRERNLRS
ncbi:MAG: hypothetical protein JKY48_17695 [Flavobacteriales bacterium]|nr:hypothetical protein [Flavobacteriales bacterium]